MLKTQGTRKSSCVTARGPRRSESKTKVEWSCLGEGGTSWSSEGYPVVLSGEEGVPDSPARHYGIGTIMDKLKTFPSRTQGMRAVKS